MVTRGSPALRGALLALVPVLAVVPACSKGRPAHRRTVDARAAAAPPPVAVMPARRFGDAMTEVGRRFERAGRAVIAGRWALADYDLGELAEVFADDLPRAPRPEDVPIDPSPLVAQFAARMLPPLVAAVRARDRAAFDAAFAAAAKECNFCHHDAAKRFIEVPGTPGVEVPVMSAVPEPGTPAPAAPGEGAPPPADAALAPVPDR